MHSTPFLAKICAQNNSRSFWYTVRIYQRQWGIALHIFQITHLNNHAEFLESMLLVSLFWTNFQYSQILFFYSAESNKLLFLILRA